MEHASPARLQIPERPAVTSTPIYDFAIVGAGIAGVSLASALYQRAPTAKILVLEQESQPGYHATGRSAAMLAPFYGPAPIRALTRASIDFFRSPPEGFCETPLLSPRGELMIARTDQLQQLEAFFEEMDDSLELVRLTAEELQQLLPFMKPGYAVAGALDESGCDIDVHGLLTGFLNEAREAGVELRANSQVTNLERDAGLWRIETTAKAAEPFLARNIVNAAGAWADVLGATAGAETIGLQPKRRSALLVDPPEGQNIDGLPLVVDIDEEFYLKPDAGRLMLSPANEDIDAPCDVQPDELDIAICIDRVQTAFDLPIKRIANKWAGLRSFVSDKSPVVGWSEQIEGFFWLAGQGGYGIQTSPALSRYAAALALHQDPPADILAQGLAPEALAPARLKS